MKKIKSKYLFKAESIHQIQPEIRSSDLTVTTFRSNNRGNFLEILRWASLTDPLVNCILNDSTSNATYLSPTIQNEILNILSGQVRRKISDNVSNREGRHITYDR